MAKCTESVQHIPKEFTQEYYNSEYFAGLKGGKAFRRSNGRVQKWSYFNPRGEFTGAFSIAKAWKLLFNPRNMLDVGAGRGTFIAYARDVNIEAEGFDFSEWAIHHRYWRCKRKWLKIHDATKPWPYPDHSFDLVTALDFFEHIYVGDIDYVASELYRVARKWIFLQIAVAGTGELQGRDEEGYILNRGESVPIGLEACAVAGHCTVQKEGFWYEKLNHTDWKPRRDMVKKFCSLADKDAIHNWLLNTIIVLESNK